MNPIEISPRARVNAKGAVNKLIGFVAALSLCGFSAGSGAAEIDESKLPPPAAGSVDFKRTILPIFEASCWRCHGAERPKGRFSLVTQETARKGGEIGIAILPGQSAKSPL